jgi:hypothetical protein
MSWVIALILFAHGIGHSMGIVQTTGLATVNPAWNGESWLLSGSVGSTWANVVAVIVWTVAIVGFCAVAATVVGWLPATWFEPLAVVSAAVSLAGVVAFPTAFPTFSTIGAVVIDLGVLFAVIGLHWRPGTALV